MQQFMIRLSTIQDIRRFVETVSMTDIEVDLSSQRYIVDGKSIMGMFCLDLREELELTAHTNPDDPFFTAIESCIVK